MDEERLTNTEEIRDSAHNYSVFVTAPCYVWPSPELIVQSVNNDALQATLLTFWCSVQIRFPLM